MNINKICPQISPHPAPSTIFSITSLSCKTNSQNSYIYLPDHRNARVPMVLASTSRTTVRGITSKKTSSTPSVFFFFF